MSRVNRSSRYSFQGSGGFGVEPPDLRAGSHKGKGWDSAHVSDAVIGTTPGSLLGSVTLPSLSAPSLPLAAGFGGRCYCERHILPGDQLGLPYREACSLAGWLGFWEFQDRLGHRGSPN